MTCSLCLYAPPKRKKIKITHDDLKEAQEQLAEQGLRFNLTQQAVLNYAKALYYETKK